MSQEVKIEDSGIISEEEEEESSDNHQHQFHEKKEELQDETLQNEESKVETNDDNINKINDESSQLNNNNFTSISKQNEDSDDINFHEESYNKESILQNVEHQGQDEHHQVITEEDEKVEGHQKQFYSKEMQERDLTNMIIEASSNSSHFTLPQSLTDGIKTKKSNSQDDYEICENKIQSQSQESQSKKKRLSLNKYINEERRTFEYQEDQEEEKTAENQVQGAVQGSLDYIQREKNISEQNFTNQDAKQGGEESVQDVFGQNEGKRKEEKDNYQQEQLQVLHSESYSHHSSQNQAFEQKSPAQNTEILQRNIRKESVLVDHQVEDSMFHMENKLNNNNGEGKSSSASASDNGDEIIQNYINENHIPHQLKMMRNKSNDSEDPQYKSGGNFFVSNMLQINQQQLENRPQSSGGVVIVGHSNNTDNYSYNSPEVIVHNENKSSSTPDIMEINFSSSNQTNSFGFSKLSVEKISSQNENNQSNNNNPTITNTNNINNNNTNTNAPMMMSIDSKLNSGSNSYELNYSIKMMHNQSTDPIDDSKRNIKQFSNDEESHNEGDQHGNFEEEEDDEDEEHNGDIILSQDHASEFSKHIFQARVDKHDNLQQIKNKAATKSGQTTSLKEQLQQDQPQQQMGKKGQQNDYYFIHSGEDKEEESLKGMDAEKRFQQTRKDYEEKQTKGIVDQNKLFQQQKGGQGKEETENKQDIFNDFFKVDFSMKDHEQSNYVTTEQPAYSMTGRNEETQAYGNLQSEENAQFKKMKSPNNQNIIKISTNQPQEDLQLKNQKSQEEGKLSKGKKQVHQHQTQQQTSKQANQQKLNTNSDYFAHEQKQQGQTTAPDNPLSLSDLNSFSSRAHQNSVLNQHNRALRNVSFVYKMLIIINCALYGYIIPQYPTLLTRPMVSGYLFVSAILSFVFKKQFIPDFSTYYKIGLGLCNLLLTDDSTKLLINTLFFGQFLFSLWNFNLISVRIRSITDAIKSSIRPNLEIFGFLVILILLFNVIYNVFNLTNQNHTGIFNFSALEQFKYYVLTIFERNFDEVNISLQEITVFFSFSCAFICLYFLKQVVENLLSIVQKVSQEQCYEYVGPHYSVGILAIFKENERMNFLYNKKALYSLLQGVFIIGFSVMQHLATIPYSNIKNNGAVILTASFLRYFSLIFIIYEISIDTLLNSAISIFKNATYILIMYDPTYYRLFAIFFFYGLCSHISYFRVLTSHIATLLLDFAVITFLNLIIQLAYIDCSEEKSISNYIPKIVMFFFISPLLKGMMLRYSEIFEIEEDEEEILSSLNAATEEQTDNQQQITDEYGEFEDEEIEGEEDRIQDTENSINHGIKRHLNSNRISNKYSNQKSFFIFSKRNIIRQGCMKIINSTLFYQVKALLLLIISTKEFFNFLCSAFSISYHNEFIIIVSYFEKFVEPALLGIIVLVNSISYGFLFNKGSYLTRSLRNLVFFALFVLIYGVQHFLSNTYFGFLRVIFLLYLLPLGIKRLYDITNAISRSKRIILQILFIFTSMFMILELYVYPSVDNRSDYVLLFINSLLYLFSVNFFVSAILVEYSKQQLRYQNPNIIWTSIRQKIANHKFNFYFIKQKNTNTQTSILYKFLKSPHHNLIISLLTGLYYLSLFLIGLVEENHYDFVYYDNFLKYYNIKAYFISGFTYFIILYCLIHISVYNLAPFFCSSALNKTLFFQSFILLVILVVDIFSNFLTEYNLKLQFLLQLPMLLRTKYMFPIVKFHKCIFRQAIVTQVVSLVMIVSIAHFTKNSRISVFEYLLIIFNLSPNQFIIDPAEGWRNLLFIVIIYLCNGISNSILLLDIIRKFDLNESAQAKNKFKQILSIFENIWDKYKLSSNPSLMKSSNLIYFLVKFDKAIEEEEQGYEHKKKRKPLKIAYLKRIMRMRIKINEEECLYYKDLLFYLVSEKFNRIPSEENSCYGSMSSFNNMTSSVFYNITAEDLELSQLSSRRRWKVYNPIKQQLYAFLALEAWKRYSDIVLHSNQQNQLDSDEEGESSNKQLEDEEEDSIFFDPNMVPAETIQQQSMNSRYDQN